MSYRVTNIQTTRTFVDQMFTQRRELEEARQQMGTGIRVNDASDDPARAGTISEFQSSLQRLQQHYERITLARVHLETQESTLDQANEIMIRAKELATQAANEPITPAVREKMAQEVFELRDTLVGLANTKYQGIYIYGGTDTNTTPFTSPTGYAEPPAATNAAANARYVYNPSVAANGTAGNNYAEAIRYVQISDSDKVRVNTPGGQLFTDAIAAVEKLGRALTGYDTAPPSDAAFPLPLDVHLQTSKIRESINLIEDARINKLTPELTSIGGRLNRVKAAEEIVSTLKLNTDTARTSIQDVDIFEAASRVTSLETSFQGLLASGAKINDLSLIDYL